MDSAYLDWTGIVWYPGLRQSHESRVIPDLWFSVAITRNCSWSSNSVEQTNFAKVIHIQKRLAKHIITQLTCDASLIKRPKITLILTVFCELPNIYWFAVWRRNYFVLCVLGLRLVNILLALRNHGGIVLRRSYSLGCQTHHARNQPFSRTVTELNIDVKDNFKPLASIIVPLFKIIMSLAFVHQFQFRKNMNLGGMR